MPTRLISSLKLLALIPILILGCAHNSADRNIAGQDAATENEQEKDDKEIKIGFISEAERLTALKSAELLNTRKIEIYKADFIKGPEQKSKNKNEFKFNDRVYCRFTVAGQEMGGRTPKFKCVIEKIERTKTKKDGSVEVSLVKIKPNDEVKVKFKPDNGENKEIHAEVAATRLFWAIGFFADSVFPVQVTCLGCPQNPAKKLDPTFNPIRAEHDFGVATIERKYPGEKLEESEAQGWKWKELSMNTKNAAATKDALLLLAAFVGHGDAKPPQQRLVCPKKEVSVDAEFEYKGCKKPKMFVQDLGATFGGAGNLTAGSAKMDLDHWYHNEEHSIWKDERECKARLNTSLTAKGSIENPVISENGRRYLAARLCQLGDNQIRDLFKAARVEQLGEDSDADSKNIEKWLEVFKMKRKQIVDNQYCSWIGSSKDKSVFDQKECDKIYQRFHSNEGGGL